MSTPRINNAAFIAGDWGTTHLRLYLCDMQGALLESVDGPGIVAASGKFADVLNSLTHSWVRLHGSLPIILCGMVGSSIGWRLLRALECPALPEDIAHAVESPGVNNVSIIPGLSCCNVLGAPDFMRGEETQILGALQLHPHLKQSSRVLCLPGTHTKWVIVKEGRVEHFITAPTGELFALLCAHSVLVQDTQQGAAQDNANDAAFAKGVDRIRCSPETGLLHQLFECRSRRLTAELSATESASFLSGLLIGSDVQGAIKLLAANLLAGNRGDKTNHDDMNDNEITVIGSDALAKLYLHAISALGSNAIIVNGNEAAREGMAFVHRALQR